MLLTTNGRQATAPTPIVVASCIFASATTPIAIASCMAAMEASGLPCLADDSGLVIPALNGQPGIYSARYSGEGDEGNNRRLLAELEGVPEEQRTARFQCVLVYLRHAGDPTPILCQGSWEGRILTQVQGLHGFGYDPLFFVPEHGCSSAELDPELKNTISHRAIASASLLDALRHGS